MTTAHFQGTVLAVATNRRTLAAVVSLLYASVALVFGVLHHHHEHASPDGHDDGCAACQWQINATSDTPVVAIPAPVSAFIDFSALPAVLPVTPTTPFLPSTASRAPPLASA